MKTNLNLFLALPIFLASLPGGLQAEVLVPGDFSSASPKEILRGLRAQISDSAPIGVAMPIETSIRPSDEVIDDQDRAGTVVEVYANQKAKVQYAFKSRIVPTESLSVKLKPQYIPESPACYGAVCVGDSVMDTKGSIGTVTTIFSNGRAMVQFSFRSRVRPVSELSTRTSSMRPEAIPTAIPVKVNDNVLDAEDNTATVLEIFSNDLAKIQYGFTSNVVPLSSLANQVHARPAETRAPCMNGLCVGDRTIDQDGNVGAIIAIYSNGKAEVQYSFTSPIVPLSTLAKAR